ncbi:hypothetical protein GA0115253_1079713 [Streptomyces sp. Termitarium-T10T-6]|nr:hypothetical protein [Streptomyces sp. Termitarium-T10T-6]SCE59335.1 hypothetical protein GA0115253_1079713 [Streptomyces sp. Termitarium-T10T-6]
MDSGFAVLAAPGPDIGFRARALLDDPGLAARLAATPSPFGDGRAGDRIVGLIRTLVERAGAPYAPGIRQTSGGGPRRSSRLAALAGRSTDRPASPWRQSLYRPPHAGGATAGGVLAATGSGDNFYLVVLTLVSLALVVSGIFLVRGARNRMADV